jgi:hypothetical protein
MLKMNVAYKKLFLFFGFFFFVELGIEPTASVGKPLEPCPQAFFVLYFIIEIGSC